MSRSFTLGVECLGTKLEWDCGSTMATMVLPSIVQDLHNDCRANEAAGHGSCGFVTHKLEGLAAYHMSRKLALKMFEQGAIGKATLMHEFAKVYAEATLSACGNYKAPLSYTLREEVELALEASEASEASEAHMSINNDLVELLKDHEWLLSVKLEASR